MCTNELNEDVEEVRTSNLLHSYLYNTFICLQESFFQDIDSLQNHGIVSNFEIQLVS